MQSWKTTIGGIVLFLSLLTGELKFEFDSDPATHANWNIVVAAAAALWTGISARDAGKSGGE